MRLFLLFSAVVLVGISFVAAADQYHALPAIPIGGEGGWDILSVDTAGRRLYLSHAAKVVVVDLDRNSIAGEIADTPGVHAFLPVPELGRGFSSNGKEAKSSVVDLKTLQVTAKLETGLGPDAIAYDSKRAEVYIFNHKGNSVTVIDAKDAKVITTIALGGSPEFAVADPVTGRVYCNVEDKSEVAVIDSTRHEIIARWPLSPGQEPSGIALDVIHHRLFATCNNKVMEMLDTESGKVVASVPIGEHVDGCAFDDGTQLVFASCGDGTTTIAREESPDKLTVTQVLRTERGARTIAIDPKTHYIYLPTAQFGAVPSPSPGSSPGRPSIIPNTCKLLVYGPAEPARD